MRVYVVMIYRVGLENGAPHSVFLSRRKANEQAFFLNRLYAKAGDSAHYAMAVPFQLIHEREGDVK